MWFNSIMIWLLKSPLHFFISDNTMLMEIKGKKSGKLYQVPMNYIRQKERLLTTSQPDRNWWRNLRGGADVRIYLKGKQYPATAVVEEDLVTVKKLLGEYISIASTTAKYFQVRLDENGTPDETDLTREAAQRVMVVTSLVN